MNRGIVLALLLLFVLGSIILALFTGGTDGGNARVVLHNAARLAELASPAVILYAGNRNVRDQVVDILEGREGREYIEKIAGIVAFGRIHRE